MTEFPGKDEKTPYIPKNYDGKEHGLLHLRDALGSSINIPAVKLLALVGVENVLRQGYRMGLTSLEPTAETMARVGLSMALGGGEVRLLEMTAAYSAFANGGYKVEPIAILKIEDNQDKVIFENKLVKPERVLDEKVAFLINSILSDNNSRLLTFGPNSYLNMGARAVAVKTGTTNDLRDNWTIGWSRDII
ncbi:MAG: Penicillin-binding protein, partial [Candidatus Collierbacteria bacterium GW2011_GWA2_44_99]